MAKDNSSQTNKAKKQKNSKVPKSGAILSIKEQKRQAMTKKKQKRAGIAANKKEIARENHQIDLTGLVFGRIATQVALLLSGKRKVTYLPYIDCGDKVTVYNLKKIKFKGGRKLEDKIYHHYSGYPGGISSIQLKDAIKKDFPKVFRRAVYQMLPKNKIRKKSIKRLQIFEEEIDGVVGNKANKS
ncbi:MAG: 50S ribosomal protein L13 [Patescibacteria group bacterium]|nr:50S ribosomal protein L13 [Patescibacteria group bacterium]